MDPKNFSTNSYYITIRVPEDEGGLPILVLEIPSFGTHPINLKVDSADIDPIRKLIELNPIVIKEEPISGSVDLKAQTDRPR